MIFGITAPKFVIDPYNTNVDVLLDYVVIQKDKPEEDIVIHTSIFTGHRSFIIKGKYWIVEMKMNLYKYTAAIDSLTPQQKYKELKQYEGLEMRYYRHRGGDYLKDSTGAEVKMFLESITESYYKTSDYKDLLLLKFRSTKYVDLTQGLGV